MSDYLQPQGSNFTVIKFKLNSFTKYCVWYLDENDDEKFQKINNDIMIFESKDSIHKFLSNKNIRYDIISFDINEIISSIENATFNCTVILEFINIATDIAKACNVEIYEELEFHTIYDKMFYGENLSIINTSDKIYHPVFEGKEISILQTYIKQCILIIKDKIFQKNK